MLFAIVARCVERELGLEPGGASLYGCWDSDDLQLLAGDGKGEVVRPVLSDGEEVGQLRTHGPTPVSLPGALEELLALAIKSAGPPSVHDVVLASIGHEIKTPMNGIAGYAQLLSQTNLTAKQRTHVGELNMCVLQLMRTINDMLDYSRLSRNDMPIHEECFAVREDLVGTIRRATSRSTKKKEQALLIRVDPSVPELLCADKLKILQVFVNLIENASKFSPARTTISVSVAKGAEGQLLCAVEDEGIGIAKANWQRVFRSFVRAQTKAFGTGLGLAICRRIVRLLGGKIWIQESAVGKGTTFAFTAAFKTQAATETLIVEEGIRQLRNRFVLVMAEDAEVRNDLTAALLRWELRPVPCSSQLEGLRVVLAGKYNFSFCILHRGEDLAEQIKEANPTLPLLAVDKPNRPDVFFAEVAGFNHLQLFQAMVALLEPRAFIGKQAPKAPPKAAAGQRGAQKEDKDRWILIVEDVVYNRNMLREMVETFGYHNIHEAVNGKVATEMMEKRTYSIVLLDLRMPVMDGLEVLEWMRAKGVGSTVVVLTASAANSDKGKCRRLGCNYFVNKPIQMELLRDVLVRCKQPR